MEVGDAARTRAAAAERAAAGLLAGEAAAEEGLRAALEEHEEGLARVRAESAAQEAECDRLRRAVAEAGTEARRRGEALERLREVCAALRRRGAEFEAEFEDRLEPAARAMIQAQAALADAIDDIGTSAVGRGEELFAPVRAAGAEVRFGLENLDGLAANARALIDEDCAAAAAAVAAVTSSGMFSLRLIYHATDCVRDSALMIILELNTTQLFFLTDCYCLDGLSSPLQIRNDRLILIAFVWCDD